MDLSFPTNPFVNQTHSFAGKTWKWNGSAWDAVLQTGGGTGTIRYTIGITPPGSPISGDKWFNTSVGLELTYLENKWVAVNAAQGDETTWLRSDGTTETVGGIPSGTTFSLGTTSTEILEQLLYPYQNVSFSSFSAGISDREVGNTFNTSSSFVWGTNGPNENWTAGSVSIEGPSGGITSGLNINQSGISISHGTYNSSTPVNKQFTISGSQTQGSNPSKNNSFGFRYRYYYGKDANIIDGSTLASAGFSSVLRTTPNGFGGNNGQEFESTNPEYVYFIYPTDDYNGTNIIFRDMVTSFEFSSVLGNTFDYQNTHGVTVEYRILRSLNQTTGIQKISVEAT